MEIMIVIAIIAVVAIAVKLFSDRTTFTPPPPGNGQVRDEDDLR